MNLRKLTFGLVALAGFGLIITLNAFTNGETKKAERYWQFNSNNISDVRTGSQYTEISEPTQSPCENGKDLPCVLKVDASIATQSELDTYLHNTSMFPTSEDITDSAIYQKLAE